MRLAPYRLARNTYQRTLNRNYWHERAAIRQFYGQFIGRGDLVFDIGAFDGRLSEAFAELGATVVAVEPNPSLAADIRRHYGTFFTVRECAVGAEPGTGTLHFGADTGLVSTLSDEWREIGGARVGDAGFRWDGEVTVEATTLAELIAEHGEPAFAKIDVEGLEPDVLAGLDRPLAALSFEFQCSKLDWAAECIGRLADLGGGYRYAHTYRDNRALVTGWMDGNAIMHALEEQRSREPVAHGDVFAVRG